MTTYIAIVDFASAMISCPKIKCTMIINLSRKYMLMGWFASSEIEALALLAAFNKIGMEDYVSSARASSSMPFWISATKSSTFSCNRQAHYIDNGTKISLRPVSAQLRRNQESKCRIGTDQRCPTVTVPWWNVRFVVRCQCILCYRSVVIRGASRYSS